MKQVTLLLLTPCLFLSGCISYQPQPLAPEKNFQILNSYKLDDPILMKQLEKEYPQYQWPASYWSLDQLVLIAEKIHPNIGYAEAQYRQVIAQFNESRQLPNPAVNVSIEHTNKPNEEQSTWKKGVGLEILIETAGKRDAKQQLAAQKVAIARTEVVDAKWQLRKQIRDALLQLNESFQTEKNLKQQLDIVNQSMLAMQKRVSVGSATRSEQLAFNSQLLAIRQQLNNVAQNKSTAMHSLATALGVTTNAVANLSIQLAPSEIKTILPEVSTYQIIQSRADVQAAMAEYAISDANLRLEVANQYPDLTLSPGLTWDAQSLIWSLASNLVLPILHNNHPAIEAADAGRLASRKKFESLQLSVRNTLDQAIDAEKLAKEQLKQAQVAIQVAEKRKAAAERAFKAGAIDKLQRLESENILLLEQANEIKSFFAYVNTVAALEDAQQLPLSSF